MISLHPDMCHLAPVGGRAWGPAGGSVVCVALLVRLSSVLHVTCIHAFYMAAVGTKDPSGLAETAAPGCLRIGEET